MTRLARIFLGILLLPLPAFAQDTPPAPSPVQVTFYSSGKTFMTLPGSRAAFVGKVFDEDRELALPGRRRFVTFNLAPGIHVLSSNWWLTTGPAGGTHLTINLVAGIHYYISTSFEEAGLGGTKIIMKEVTCEDAQQANVDTKPLEQKHLRPDGIASALTQTTFPQCQ
jgi:hypothetical protein